MIKLAKKAFNECMKIYRWQPVLTCMLTLYLIIQVATLVLKTLLIIDGDI